MFCVTTAAAPILGNVVDLKLAQCRIGADETVVLLQALSTASRLKTLDVSGNIIDLKGVIHLGKHP